MLPVVGVPMPLISYGGTSAVSLLAGFGVLMSIHANRQDACVNAGSFRAATAGGISRLCM